jgi:hypothetical protein
MKQFASEADCLEVEGEMPWQAREVPATTYGLISQARAKHAHSNALSFQMFSGERDVVTCPPLVPRS